VWFGLVWFGLVWFGLVWFGLGWFLFLWKFGTYHMNTCQQKQLTNKWQGPCGYAISH
jgi:hypothetical protein